MPRRRQALRRSKESWRTKSLLETSSERGLSAGEWNKEAGVSVGPGLGGFEGVRRTNPPSR